MKFKSIILLAFLTATYFSAISQDAEEIFQKGNSLTWDGKYEEALDYVNRSLAIDSSLYQRFGFRAEIKENLGLYSEAIDDITKCINKCSCKTRKYHVASYYLERAELYIKKGDSTSALSDANNSIKTNPNDWKAYNYRSKLLIKNGQNQEALTDLNKSISIDNNQAESYQLRGELLVKLNRSKEACGDLTKIIGWGFDEYESWVKKNCN